MSEVKLEKFFLGNSNDGLLGLLYKKTIEGKITWIENIPPKANGYWAKIGNFWVKIYCVEEGLAASLDVQGDEGGGLRSITVTTNHKVLPGEFSTSKKPLIDFYHFVQREAPRPKIAREEAREFVYRFQGRLAS